jgi:hypothetical protein
MNVLVTGLTQVDILSGKIFKRITFVRFRCMTLPAIEFLMLACQGITRHRMVKSGGSRYNVKRVFIVTIRTSHAESAIMRIFMTGTTLIMPHIGILAHESCIRDGLEVTTFAVDIPMFSPERKVCGCMIEAGGGSK